ncbi:MAG TPA: hypothetical protein VGG19_10775 [Tepidisphaeraceae bacterium]|jgi:hypothetical protein
MKRIALALLFLTPLLAAETPTTQPSSDAPGQSSTPIIREGSYIVDRVGHLTHSADGQQFQFVFDRATAVPGEPSINILQNLNLMLMENAVASNSQDIHFKITGIVTEYRGKNYVLLQKVVVVR